MSVMLTIIIVNWNTSELLASCLESLAKRQKRAVRAGRVQVIVVDNASKDGSEAMVRTSFPEVDILNSGENIGFGKANNLGIPLARGKFVLFLNPDTIVHSQALQRMVEFMQGAPTVGGLGPRMVYPDGRIQGLGLQWFPSPWTELFNLLFVSERSIARIKNYLPYRDPEQSGYVRKIYGGAFLVRKEVLSQVGGFDERFFMYGEDVDLCARIQKAGWKLYYLSEAEIVHLVGGAAKNTTSQFSTLMKCESISKLMEKYYGRKGRMLYGVSIFCGASFRLIVLGILWITSLKSSHKYVKNYRQSVQKYAAMLEWTLNLRKPVVKE
jgi:GT2 family glycosyltransferase